MAFGRRRTGSAAGTGAPVGVAQPRSRGWKNMGRRKRGAASTIASNKAIGGPKTKMTDMQAASGRRMAVAGAVIGEKFAHLGASMKFGFYAMSHPAHPLQKAAARERAVNVKAAATERKRQKIARAIDIEMRKRALVRERRAARLQTAL